MPEISLTIQTENADKALEVFKGERVLNASGMKIELQDTVPMPGMLMEEVVINLAISLVAGVPSSMLATYIMAKFSNDGENLIRMNEKLVKDVQELQLQLQQFIDKNASD